MQCVLCGNNDSFLPLDNLCPTCYSATNPLLAHLTSKTIVRLPFCSLCSSIKIGRKWYSLENPNVIEFLQTELTRILGLPKDVILLVHWDTIEYEYSPNGIPIILSIQLTAQRNILPKTFIQSETIKISIDLNVKPCISCTQIKSAKYEAILQLRANNRSLDPEEIESISQLVVERTEKAFLKNPKNYISRIDEMPNGLDFYFGNASLAIRLARELSASTAAQLTISHKRVSADPSLKHATKRTTLSLRLPFYSRGDFISFQIQQESTGSTDLFQVLNFNRGMIQYYSYKHNVKQSIPVKQFNERKPFIIASIEHVHAFMVVALLDDSIQLMDSQTYKMYEIRKPSFDINIIEGNNINAILIDGGPYISAYSYEKITA